jgi:H+/Cl- antiporter ClcA
MRLTGRLTQPQKIVVVIALGVVCAAAGIYLVSLGSTASFGWYAYAPLSQGVDPRTGLAGWLRLIIWLALTGLWALASIRVLRPAPAEPPG